MAEATAAVDVSVGDTHKGTVVVDMAKAKATMTTRKEPTLNGHSVQTIVE